MDMLSAARSVSIYLQFFHDIDLCQERIVGHPGGVSISDRCVVDACVATASGK